MAQNNSSAHDLTQLLAAWSDGDQEARDELMLVVYQELHESAYHHIKRESPCHTLQTSARVNESFLRLGDQKVQWRKRDYLAVVSIFLALILNERAIQYRSA